MTIETFKVRTAAGNLTQVSRVIREREVLYCTREYAEGEWSRSVSDAEAWIAGATATEVR